MDDDAFGGFEDAAEHRDAFVVWTDFQAADSFCEYACLGAAVVGYFVYVFVPVASLDCPLCVEVVEVGFVEDDDAGVFEGGFVDGRVVGVVA
jgi:hypothetical protein